MIIHGRNLILKVNGVAVAGARSCELTVQAEEIEVSSASQGRWREFIAGRKEWTLSCSQLVSEIEDSVDMVGATVEVKFEVRDTLDYVYGTAIVTQWTCTGTIGNLSQGSYRFRGTGFVGK